MVVQNTSMEQYSILLKANIHIQKQIGFTVYK